MAKLTLSQSGINFNVSVTPEVLTEYLKTDVSEMNLSEKLGLFNKIKKELKENIRE